MRRSGMIRSLSFVRTFSLAELFATLGQLVRLGGGPFFTAPEPSTAMLLWAVFYAAVAVGLALYKFERQDL